MSCQQAVQKKGTGSVLSERPHVRHSTGKTNRRAWRHHLTNRSWMSPRNIAGETLQSICVCVSSKRMCRVCQGCCSVNGCDIRRQQDEAQAMRDERERRDAQDPVPSVSPFPPVSRGQ